MSQNTLPTAAKKRSLLVILLLLITVAACGAAGYSWWLLQQKNDGAPVAAKPQPPTAPVFMPLDTFTVNLLTPDNNPDRVLYIGLTLRLPDEATRRQLNDFLPEVRSRLLMLLSRQEAAQLANEQGKQQLVAQIKDVLSPPLVKGQPKQVVSDVLFTAFILR
ncbi:flagellar basal body-associated protein FliL [Serratia odorifera]|jgi:flagellar protein FliL|uniref:Flagellar protein FliL n=2 Tax=Serratia odorifera TaxID=618 RepID=D4E4W6_SEROD|nr:flagellar basal body-associated protein FliL [Serratia odorifera]EFE95162.1 flagellar basal body-associated protein FliL [Serratia odorifera DSM 4582]MBJ2064482.1 flagellar basal body-associated protein FliL [Serratia odorifera]PNK89890.1 flagellar basal body-associated protein FliL [Serratia odorifera]RII70526.1 flagellar basal body-associated protein FliL [Serratia odorifera]VDZ61700.1 flagellar basal body-associated protein FliL [Serratia odorifera]